MTTVTMLNINQITNTLLNEINEGISYLEKTACKKHDRTVLDRILPDLKDDILGSPKYYNKANRGLGIATIGNDLIKDYYNKSSNSKSKIVVMLVLAKLKVLHQLSTTVQSQADENLLFKANILDFQSISAVAQANWQATIQDGIDNKAGIIKIKEQNNEQGKTN